MRRKRPYTEPDRIKERIVLIKKNHHEGCRHDCDEETMICKRCGDQLIRLHWRDTIPRITPPIRFFP